MICLDESGILMFKRGNSARSALHTCLPIRAPKPHHNHFILTVSVMILIPEEKQIHRAASTPYDLILLSSSDTVEPITCTIMSNGNLKI